MTYKIEVANLSIFCRIKLKTISLIDNFVLLLHQQTTPATQRCVLGVVFYFRPISLELYNKKSLSYKEQLELLKKRGLLVENEIKALHLLESLSYYRLSGYFYPQLTAEKESHIFKPFRSFKSSFQMYCFDRELRLLLIGNIEKIEIAFRAKMTYVFSQRYDPFWYTYDKLFKNEKVQGTSLSSIKKSIEDSTEDFVIQYKRKYLDNYLPSWMAMEIVTFSHLSKTFENFDDKRAKAEVAKYFGVPYQLLENWLLILTYSRNICAHHSRFWNREFSLKALKSNKELDHDWIDQNGVIRNRAYMYLSITGYLLNRVNPKNTFKTKLIKLFEKYENIDYNQSMGFPKDWEDQPLWK